MSRLNFYRDIAVLAFPWKDTAGIHLLKDLAKKAAFEEAGFSANDTRYLTWWPFANAFFDHMARV